MRRLTLVTLAIAATVLLAGAGNALSATSLSYVGNCGGSAPNYSTIQAAVNAVTVANWTIKVCPGTYVEQVTIPAATPSGLTLQSDQHWAATIKAPAAMTASKTIVRVNGGQSVKIKDFVIAGPGGGGCDGLEYGVRVDMGGTATIQSNHIQDIRDNPFSGCQNGVGIQVGRAADSTVGNADIKGNTIDGYQKNGITISNTGSGGAVTGNTITGADSTSVNAQNGVQISSGATSSVMNNTISKNRFVGNNAATGVLLFDPGAVTVSQNTESLNDISVYAYQTDSSTTISSNTISGSTYDGITLLTSTGLAVTGNSTNTGDQGIGVYDTSGATVKGNTAAGNASYGFFADTDTFNNIFKSNTGSTSGIKDCRDASTGSVSFGTANTWPVATNSNANHGTSTTGICT